MNLLSNAIKYTEKGKITLSLKSNEEAIFSIQDTGKGIDADDIPRIFIPFGKLSTSLSNVTEHSGLGLAITKRIVELYYGKIEVQSKKGEGSKFIVTLPLSKKIQPS